MTTTLLLLAFSFTIGLSIGIQIKHIVDGIHVAIDAVATISKANQPKRSGVVRPGLESAVPHNKSAVVRPRLPTDTVDEGKELVLQNVRNRVSS